MKKPHALPTLALLLVLCPAARAQPATPGIWVDITPPGIVKGAPETCIGQGLALDPKDPAIIYWGTTPYNAPAGGLFKSGDGGKTWKRIGKVQPAFSGATDIIDMPLHVRIDPADSRHLYVGDGVRGSSQGFFISHDGGETLVKPKGLKTVRDSAQIDNEDIYDVAVDPADFNHVLLSFHYRWGWTETKWNTNSGILESQDGGETWKVHEPVPGWGSGHAIKFLHHPGQGRGNSNTWLLGTQGNGYWRTEDAGAHWTQVSKTNISHGGGTLYYSRSGALYASGEQTLRSLDNGLTWSTAWSGSSWCVFGDGNLLYTGRPFGGNQPFQVSAESDGLTWKDFNAQKFADGPYEMAFDAANGILYSSSWSDGLWAVKVAGGNGVIRPVPRLVQGGRGNRYRLNGAFLGAWAGPEYAQGRRRPATQPFVMRTTP